jgi:ribonuclease HII
MDNSFDKLFYNKGSLLAGVDETGVSDIAGPLVSACVILPIIDPDSEHVRVFGVDDSKKIKEKYLERHAQNIVDAALGVGIGVASPQEIDFFGKRKACILSMVRAVANCQTPFKIPISPDFILIDGDILLPLDTPQEAIKEGDSKSLSIAAASILAKVFRNTAMKNLHSQFPFYAWDRNKGFPCDAQFKGLDVHGVQLGVHRANSWPLAPDPKRDNPELHKRRTLWRELTLKQKLKKQL